jgi:hypothetical protein
MSPPGRLSHDTLVRRLEDREMETVSLFTG